MIAGPVDVLVAGPEVPEELAALSDESVSVETVRGLLGAVGRLRAGTAGVVLVPGESIRGRESDALGALRRAGASSIVVLYPPHLGHLTRLALSAGADRVLVDPHYPGELRDTVHDLLEAERTTPTQATRAVPPPTSTIEPVPDDSVASLVGDVGLLNRSMTDLERLLDQTIATFQRRSRATRASLLLKDELRDELYLRKTVGHARDFVAPPVRVGQGLAGHVAASGRALLVQDTERFADERPDLGGHLRRRDDYSTRSFLILPLRASEGVAGVLCLADKGDGAAFDEHDRRSLSFLAEHAGQTLENALKFRHLQDLAVIDELTGLYNRRQFQSSLEREVQRSRRYGRGLTLALFDLDHFKLYNDRCGHPAGDRALATVGEILRSSLREVDIVARYGGEEFAVILPETSANPEDGSSDPFPFLDRLRRRVAEARFDGEEKLPGGQLTLSGGLACFPQDAETVEELVQAADRALYVSKSRGRNLITYRDGPAG